VPVRRLLIDERVFVANGAVEVQNGRVPVLSLRRDLACDDFGRDAQDRKPVVRRERRLLFQGRVAEQGLQLVQLRLGLVESILGRVG
jgi:hypothetical protein